MRRECRRYGCIPATRVAPQGQPRTAPRSGLRSDTDAHAPPATHTAHTTVSRRLILDATHHMNQLHWGATLGAVVGPSSARTTI